ncbi:MAG: hypothetical protein KBS76_07595 [Ruminococcus sp.]|nr:hypothetical protein [Candidatus Apopatosoma intestinale]
MRKTKKTALCALLVSVSVILMLLGSVTGILDMTTAAVAAFVVVFCTIEFGLGYGFAVYGATSLLSVLLLPEKTAAWCYLLFFGLHVLLIPILERLGKTVSFLVRLVIMNGTLAILYFFFAKLLELPDAKAMKIVFAILANLIFILSDRLYGILIRLYFYKNRPKIAKYLK